MGTLAYQLPPWSTSVEISRNPNCLCGGCDITKDPDDNFFACWVEQGGAVWVAASADGGFTWTATNVVAGGVQFYRHAAVILADSVGYLYLFYVDGRHRPMMAKSANSGLSWSKTAIQVGTLEFSRQLDAVMTEDDVIHLMLRTDDDGLIKHCHSRDQGNTWSIYHDVATPLPHLYWATNVRLTIDQRHHLYVVAEAIVLDQRESFLSRSRDGGLSWSPWSTAWHNGHARNANIVASGQGELTIVYLDDQRLRVARSTDGGSTWCNYTVLSDSYVFDLWSVPGLLRDPGGNLHVMTYLGGVHTLVHLYSTDQALTWTLGATLFSATEWKTPADIRPIWADGAIQVAATVGISHQTGMVRFIRGDPVVILTPSRLSRVDPDFLSSAVGNHCYLMDAGCTDNGLTISTILERTGLSLGQNGEVVTVLEVWPDASLNAAMGIQVGSQMDTGAQVVWSDMVIVNPFTTAYASVRVTGRYIAVRFTILTDADWQMSGYSLFFESAGFH